MIPGNILHSNPVGTPSTRFISLKRLLSEHHLILLFQVAIGSSPIFSHTEHRVGEDVGIGVGDLRSLAAQ